MSINFSYMNEEQKESKGLRKKMDKLLLGVVIGGAVGSILGVTLAPKSGKETRKELQTNAKDAWDKISHAVEVREQKKKSIWHTLNNIFVQKK